MFMPVWNRHTAPRGVVPCAFAELRLFANLVYAGPELRCRQLVLADWHSRPGELWAGHKTLRRRARQVAGDVESGP